MRLRLVGAALVIEGLCILGSAQTSTHTAHRSTEKTAEQTKTAATKPAYLSVPFDPSATHLAPQFKGHDIVAISDYIKQAPALAPKSEFETTAAYEARRASFPREKLTGNINADSHLAFVIDEERLRGSAEEFRYNADAGVLKVSLTGRGEKFFLERNQPEMQTVTIRSSIQSSEKYMASNAFGAKVEVTDIYSESYGLSFSSPSWVFERSYAFSQVVTMAPELASKIKADLRFLIVCRLQEPWYLHSATGHDATIDNPVKVTEGLNFLQVLPEQIWIVDVRSGEIISKFNPETFEADKAEKLKAELREFPLIIELSADNNVVPLRVRSDDGEEHFIAVNKNRQTLRAKTQVALRWSVPSDTSDLTITVNGKPYNAHWQTKETIIGSHRFIDEATVTVRAEDVAEKTPEH